VATQSTWPSALWSARPSPTIVNSLVKDLINPPLGFALGGIDFSNFFVVLKGDAAYATFESGTGRGRRDRQLWSLHQRGSSNFLIVAAALFLVLRQGQQADPRRASWRSPAIRRRRKTFSSCAKSAIC